MSTLWSWNEHRLHDGHHDQKVMNTSWSSWSWNEHIVIMEWTQVAWWPPWSSCRRISDALCMCLCVCSCVCVCVCACLCVCVCMRVYVSCRWVGGVCFNERRERKGDWKTYKGYRGCEVLCVGAFCLHHTFATEHNGWNLAFNPGKAMACFGCSCSERHAHTDTQIHTYTYSPTQTHVHTHAQTQYW